MYECNIAEKLIELRTAKGVTQEDVANALAVSNKTISKWENGVSAPDLPMLIELSKYYNVSTDVLLGIAMEEKQTAENFMKAQFEGLDGKAIILKAFELVLAMIPAGYQTIKDEDADVILPEKLDRMNRSCISRENFYQFTVNSEAANMAVMLLQNQEDFKWMVAEESAERIAKLFDFLSNADALKLCHFIHSRDCSGNFTADYVANNLEFSVEQAEALLSEGCEIGLCSSHIAHLERGVVTIYESFGSGMILSLITLAYEYMCGKKSYNYCINSSSKMIGGGKA